MFSVLLIVVFLLTGVIPAQTVSAISFNTVDQTARLPVEAELSAGDWGKVEALLPASVDVTPVIQSQQAYLKASNNGVNDNFGNTVSLSGDTLVVGAPFEDSNANGVDGNQADNSAVDSGAVYIFIRIEGVWSQQAYLKASNTKANDHFGSAVSISDNTLVVGASGTDAAYVFIHSGATWSQQAYLEASNPAYFRDDRFGEAVSLSGDTLVVGASGEDSNATGVNGNGLNNTVSESGAAYVFVRSGTTWNQQAYLKASNTEVNDYFGNVVSISGDTIVVGAFGEDSSVSGINGDQADNSKLDSGAAYVFTRTGVVWSQQAYLKASNPDESDRFGRALSLSDDTLVVGAPYESSFSSVVNGNQNDNSAYSSGAVYVFSRTVDVWSQQEYIKPSNTGTGDLFGHAVSLAGDMLVVGAPLEDSSSTGVNGSQVDIAIGIFPANESGAAYIFARNGTTWEQQTYLKASNTGIDDQFGSAVSASGDLSAIGAPLEDSTATGVNGDQSDNAADASGAAYVFGVTTTITTPRTDYSWSRMVADAPNKARSMDFKLDSDGTPHMVLGGDHLYYATLNAGTWELETVDHAPGVGGRSVSLVFDSNNHPHIAYQGSSVQYAYWNGSDWTLQSIPNSVGDAYVSIALDSSDQPKIVFSDSSASRGLRYANWTGTKWVVQQVDSCSSLAPSLVIDPNNVPHISYHCAGLRYATLTDNSWHVDSVNTTIDASGETSIAVDTNGWPHIAYNPPFPTAGIGYVSWNGTAWDMSEVVDATGVQGVSLLIDDLDMPHVSYSGSGRVLNEATFNGSTWDIQTVPDAAKICSRTSLALDASGNRHIGYVACLPENFYYTYETSPGTWSTPQVIVESSIFGSPSTSMAIDQNDHPHLSTEDWYQGTLRYSSWDGAQWLNQIVDHVGVKNTHVYSSIKTDSNNRPHIAYFGTGGLLKYASWDGTQWQIESLGMQGLYASLALEKTTDFPRIAFCSDGLKYASWDGSVWNIETIDPVCGKPDYGAENSLVLDAQGNPHIAYVNGYVYWDAENSVWIKDASAPIGGVTALALESDGSPHISSCGYNAPNHQVPQYASWDGSLWNSTTIDDPIPSQNAVCLTTSLAIDDNNIPHVSYVEPYGDTLRLVTRNNAVWSSQIVETNAMGLYTPMVAGPNNDLWIAYLDRPTGSLMVAHGTPVPPSVSAIQRADANPTGATSVDFIVTFSESVAGVDSTDFSLTTTGVSGATITNVSNDLGATRTVTVNTGSGNGTIRLDVVDDNTIIDVVNDPLGGVTAGDGDFNSGEAYDVVKPSVFNSTATQDGWILESSETSNKGGTMNGAATLLYVGDNAQDKQYRSFLSFDTSTLPVNAVITSVTLKFQYSGKTGTLPFGTHGNLLADVCKGSFKNNLALQLSDFNVKCPLGMYKSKVLTYTNSKVDNWYSQSFNSADFQFVNLGGVTQFRLRFTKDDNDDLGADYLKIYSGDAGAASRPQLIVEYYVP